MSLRTNYSDDVLDTSKNTKRKYSITNNPDGTISLTDETAYLAEGDYFGAEDINATNEMVNTMFDYFVMDGWVSKNTQFLPNGDIRETDRHSNYSTLTKFNQDGTITQQLFTPEGDLITTRTVTFTPTSIDESIVYED